jgi:hypothetical protein
LKRMRSVGETAGLEELRLIVEWYAACEIDWIAELNMADIETIPSRLVARGMSCSYWKD